MRRSLVFAALIAAFSLTVSVSAVAEATYDAAGFATCSACHLQEGQGIPGAFPPVRNRAAQIAALEGGREFLIAVVSYGLMGPIQVDGTNYASVMPGNVGLLQPEAIAAALNYLVFELQDDDAAANDIEPYTADEVSAYQASQEGADFNSVAELRKALV